MNAHTATTTASPSAYRPLPTRGAQRFALGLLLIVTPPRIRRLIWSRMSRYMRGLATTHFALAVVFAGLGALLLSQGYSDWALLPLAGVALHSWIGYLDVTVARSAPSRS